jgi:hypothetical protein
VKYCKIRKRTEKIKIGKKGKEKWTNRMKVVENGKRKKRMKMMKAVRERNKERTWTKDRRK